VCGKRKPAVDRRPADALDRFLDRRLWQADERDFGQAALGDVGFDLTGDGLDAD
jgi:hypothetical protein